MVLGGCREVSQQESWAGVGTLHQPSSRLAVRQREFSSGQQHQPCASRRVTIEEMENACCQKSWQLYRSWVYFGDSPCNQLVSRHCPARESKLHSRRMLGKCFFLTVFHLQVLSLGFLFPFQKEILGIEALEERVKPALSNSAGSPCGEDPGNLSFP